MWTRPPKLKLSPPYKVRSVSEKTPNWNTGTATVCSSRRSRTSDPPVEWPVTVTVYFVRMPLKPVYGPALMFASCSGFGLPALAPVSGVHEMA